MTKVLTIKISKFEDIIELSSMPFHWRGQSNSSWELQTNLERQVDKTFCSPEIEKQILREFKRKQHLFESSRDVLTNDFERIAKIQHHGGPTRLLDFTSSILKALYFATEDFDDSVDFAIWGVNCNDVNGPHRNPNIEKMLIELIFGQTSDLFTKYINGTLKEKSVVFIEPYLLNHRLQVQQGLFAIPLDTSIRFIDNLNSLFETNIYEELTKNEMDFRENPFDVKNTEDFLNIFNAKVIKIIISKKLKRGFKTRLRPFGISTEMIYPDLDGFCKSLVSNCESQPSTFKY
jgi:hypothetical protein